MSIYQAHNSNINNSSISHHFARDNHEIPINLPPLEKQRLGYILDDNHSNDEQDAYHKKKLPSLTSRSNTNNYQFVPYEPSKNLQRLPSPFSSSVSDEDEEREDLSNNSTPRQQAQPTANEVQYIKRIQALMTLVARQTNEIQSLRAIIATSQTNDRDRDTTTGRKRNKMQ
jgi:hypothetical protein